MQAIRIADFEAEDVTSFGYVEHLLVRSWRRLAVGSQGPLTMREFDDACGADAAEVFLTFSIFLKALAVAGRRPLAIGMPGSLSVTTGERQVLTLLAAAQDGTPTLFQAHLRWLARSEQRHILEIAAGALATALKVNGLLLIAPAAAAPSVCEHRLAIA